MIEFLKHKKFWLPLVILMVLLLLIEALLRAGWYDRIVSPLSFMGNTLKRLEAFEKFGMERIDWVTLGDSKMDWGIDHGLLRAARAEDDINHLRFSMPGSNFLSTHSMAEWSLDHLPQLQGILLGLYEHEFIALGNTKKEFKITWPFKEYWRLGQFKYFKKRHMSKLWLSQWAFYNYAGDIKNWLSNPLKRQRMHENRDSQWLKELDFLRDMPGNLCHFDLSSLATCIDSASHFKATNQVPETAVSPYRKCANPKAKKRLMRQQYATKTIDLAPHLTKWRYLFDRILQRQKQLTLLLLPENEFFAYMSKPSNTHELVDGLIKEYQDNPHFKVIDLRDLFAHEQQCLYFRDTLHFNNKGIQRVTQALIAALKQQKTPD